MALPSLEHYERSREEVLLAGATHSASAANYATGTARDRGLLHTHPVYCAEDRTCGDEPSAGTTAHVGTSSPTQGSRPSPTAGQSTLEVPGGGVGGLRKRPSQTFFDKVVGTSDECKLLLLNHVLESQDVDKANGSNQDGLM
ncbi:hypothetical protein AnigIFM56816_008593 [Aspergillus niger]|nr:hypothetical protein AnigIFM56816_008593 [Aspergillus niger]